MIIFRTCSQWLSLSSLVDWYLTDQHSHYAIPLPSPFFPLPPTNGFRHCGCRSENLMLLFFDPDGNSFTSFIVTTPRNRPDVSHLDALTALTHFVGSVCCRCMMPVFLWLGTSFRFFLQTNWNPSDLIIWHLFTGCINMVWPNWPASAEKLSLDGTTRY